MFLIKTDNGYVPAYPSDKEQSDKIKIGEEVYATKKRNIGWHRKGFALLKLGFENQDKIDNFDIYRMIVTMKAGFVHFVKGIDGKEYPLPHSLAFDKMNAEEFEHWYGAVKKVIGVECRLSGAQIEEEINNHF